MSSEALALWQFRIHMCVELPQSAMLNMLLNVEMVQEYIWLDWAGLHFQHVIGIDVQLTLM